jgi:hypothetical protein
MLLIALTASLAGVCVPLALAGWAGLALVTFELWYGLEPLVLRRLGGCRAPTEAERQRLESALGRTHLCLLIASTGSLSAGRGLRCLVVGRDLLELFEDRALAGLLNQVAAPLQAANLAGFVLVWLGNLPLLGAWCVTRLVSGLARLLAIVIATSLVVPLLLWRDAFLGWVGRLLASVWVGLLASMLLSSGFAAAGLLLLVGWLAIPGLGAVLAWESRRAERSADAATIEAGYGAQLLEAADLLTLVEPAPGPAGVLRLLCRPGVPSGERSSWIRRRLYGWAAVGRDAVR